MSAHTPGPWVVNPFAAQVDCSKPSRIGGLLPIAQLLWPTDERSEAETEANGLLIAAAPCVAKAARSLLAAAEMTTFSDQYPAECEALRAALARSEGRS